MEQPSSFTKAKQSSSSSSSSISNNSKHPKAKKISISILVISLPVLYVSLLHIPPSTLLKDTTFWFLMSNSIIIIIAADSGIFSSSGETGDLYDEFIKHSRSRSASLVAELPLEASIKESPKELLLTPSQLDAAVDKSIVVRENSVLHLEKPVDKSVVVKEKSFPHEGRVVDKSVVAYEKPLRQSVSKKEDHRRLAGSGRSNLEENKYSKLSDEELNKKVEEFITRFNREIRLQLRNE